MSVWGGGEERGGGSSDVMPACVGAGMSGGTSDGGLSGGYCDTTGADGDGLLGWVLRGAVGLGEIRNNYLGVAFGAQGTGLQKGQAIKDASAIHVGPCFDVVQSIGNTVQAAEKVVSVDILGVGTNAILLGFGVHLGVHGLDGLGGGGGLGLAHVVGPEQELPVQVATLDMVHVSDDNFA